MIRLVSKAREEEVCACRKRERERIHIVRKRVYVRKISRKR